MTDVFNTTVHMGKCILMNLATVLNESNGTFNHSGLFFLINKQTLFVCIYYLFFNLVYLDIAILSIATRNTRDTEQQHPV